MKLDARQTIATTATVAPPLLSSFVADERGEWQIEQVTGLIGESLAAASRLGVVEGESVSGSTGRWVLRGTTSNNRYTERRETSALIAVQEGLRRPSAVKAALIPIRKSAAWWALAQDERRAIFEEQSHHIRIGFDYLPAIARRLYHSRDLGGPFDFLTWFEYAPEFSDAFERLLDRLRATTEWTYVEREVDIRLSRCPTT